MARGPAPEPLKIRRKTRRELKLLVRRRRAPYCVVQRARIILYARDGYGTEEIARRMDCDARNVRKWKARFRANPSLAAIEDAPRSGRPAQIPVTIRCQLVQLACARPNTEEAPAPFRDVWTYGALADALAERTGYRLSVTEVGRILPFGTSAPAPCSAVA